MGTTRGLERLIFFTDAITAIAITLLILPLVDSVPEAAAESASATEFLADRFAQLVGFVISFAVTARLWLAHHAVFEHVRAYDQRIVSLTLIWAFTIVVLPLPTALTSEFPLDPETVAFYIGTMLASSLCILLLAVRIRRHPHLEASDNPVGIATVVGSAITSVGFAVALVVGTLVPTINYYALLILLLAIPVESAINRRIARRESAEDDHATS